MKALPGTLLGALLAALLSTGGATASDSQHPELRFNPFSRPDLTNRASAGAPRASAAWAPVLRATLVAGPDSMANLGGIVLRRGQAAHGYRLIGVKRWEAIFRKDGRTVVLQVDPEEAASR